MNFFEQQLRILTDTGLGIAEPTFAGRSCYGDLGNGCRIKIQFITIGHHEKYEAVKATVLNRSEGIVDSLVIRFSDIWESKPARNFPDGLIPHIRTFGQESNWYICQPTETDFRELAGSLKAYMDVFSDISASIGQDESRPCMPQL